MYSLQIQARKQTGLRSVQTYTCMRLKVLCIYMHTHTYTRARTQMTPTSGHVNSVTPYPELICVSYAYVSCAFSSFPSVHGNV